MVETKSEFYKIHHEQWKSSHQSVKAYSETHNLVPTTFKYWINKIEGDQKIKQRFKEVKIGQITNPLEIRILKSNGTEIYITNGINAEIIQMLVQC
jgi:hypothetical protein